MKTYDVQIEIGGRETVISFLLAVGFHAYWMARGGIGILLFAALLTVVCAVGWVQYWRDVDQILNEMRELEEQEDNG